MTSKSNHSFVLLKELGEVSSFLLHSQGIKNFADETLKRVCDIFDFDLSVLYKVTNVIDHILILEVEKIYDPNSKRNLLVEGSRISVDLNSPEQCYINEAEAVNNQSISKTSVPGIGCDLAGFLVVPDFLGKGYLLACDYVTEKRTVSTEEEAAFEVICNMFGSYLIKHHFKQLATYDALTGIFNRDTITKEVQKLFDKHQREQNITFAVTLADLDFFKKINDTYGHIQGDVVLEEFAKLVYSNSRHPFDSVGRYGGEEFIILSEDTGSAGALTYIERIRKKVENHPFKKIGKNGQVIPGESIHVTASFGVAIMGGNNNSENISQLLNQADEALYRSKKEGRNRVSVYKA